MREQILEMRAIVKEFSGVRALDGVSFAVQAGEIHALVGENGAGKSTLMKIVSGVYPYGSYQGELLVDGSECRFKGIKASEAAGVAIIHQELALVNQLSVAENIMLGQELASVGVLDQDRSLQEAARVLKLVGLDLPPATEVRDLGVGQQQLVAIAKALHKDARILILDEPTAALSDDEADLLLRILRELREKGVTCIYISHRLREVLEIADRITVMRDGRTVGTVESSGMTEAALVTLMVGRELAQIYPRTERTPGELVMELRNWSVTSPATRLALHDISLSLRTGEILGIAGLVGAGRTELVMSLFGAWGTVTGGTLLLNGRELTDRTPERVIRAGISLASEDRKRYGLVLNQEIRMNITLPNLEKVSSNGVLDESLELTEAQAYRQKLAIRCASVEQAVGTLSGGNQQKVVLAKWMMTGPKVLILDEPTRGIDVGAKAEIYGLINQMVDSGICVLVISSELPELLGICDRIAVMHEGRITGELPIAEATQEKIMLLATGST
jgi:ABC-type sugar transport system ATPase subunit